MALLAEQLRDGAANDPIRVMVVDDSVVVRGLISRWVSEDGDLILAGVARNGRQAVDEIARIDPDVVVLDVEMPEMDGLTALPLLLKAKPGVIVIVASTLTRRNAEISFKALSLGARDYVPKPEGNVGVSTAVDFRREIVEKIKGLGLRAKARRKPSAPASPPPAPSPLANPARLTVPARSSAPPSAAAQRAPRPFSSAMPRILTIGSSTGGPQALMEIFKHLQPLFPRVPVLVTQHMPATFTAILAEHLTRVSGIEAREARDGEAIAANHIYVAPGGLHMTVQRQGDHNIIRLLDTPPINFCKPAVDPMFDSVAAAYGAATLGLVLTGMGADGSRGALTIAQAGGSVIVQDEQTSVVWGMPGATVNCGAAAAVLPLPQIASKLVQLCTGAR